MKTLRQLIDEAENRSMEGWRAYIDYFELDERSRQLSPHTIRVNDGRLSLLARWLHGRGIGVEAVTRNEIQQYLISCYGQVSDETIAGRIRTSRRFWNVLIEGGVWTKPNPLDGVKKPRISQKLRKTITPMEFELVLGTCNKRSFLGYRNFTMLLMLWDCMLRRAEIANLQISDIDLRAGVMRIKGKGNKVRMVPIGAKTAKTLHYYLNKWRSRYPGNHVFCSRQGAPFALHHIRQICYRQAKKVGVHMGAHIIRHSAATEYLRRGGQLSILSKILGHSDISTTAIYTHLLTEDMVKSYDQFSPANSLNV